jgi:hypothetical protein
MFGRTWIKIRDGDRRALALYRRHYSWKKRCDKTTLRKNGERFTPPGESIVLITPKCDALFVWSKQKYRMDNQEGISCSIFRNEGDRLSSELILEAEKIVWRKWPGKRLFTLVDPEEVESANPGFCFKEAGWRFCGRSAKGHHVLEKE